MLELYHWEPNGSFLKPLIVLHEKGLAFGSHYVDLLSFQRPQDQLAQPSFETQFNPEGEGPILVHDGRQVTESLFIAEYLEDAFPAVPLRPVQAIGQTRILAWARFINEVLMPAVSTLGCKQYLAPYLATAGAGLSARITRLPPGLAQQGWSLALKDDYPADLLEDSRRKVGLGVKRLEETLAGSSWLVGSDYSLADIDAFSIGNALPGLTPDIVNDTATPHLLRWLERIRARPAVRAALALSRTGRPEQAFAPGPEHSRWG